MMRALALFLALAACTPTTNPALPDGGYRTAGAPIYSIAQFDPSRLRGKWVEVAGFTPDGARCNPGGAEFRGNARNLTMTARLCPAGRGARLSGPVTITGPGRLQVAGQEWWVIWVDTDYRTLALATPSGGYGIVLNRDGPISRDRLTAAAEIFSFNGYDRSQFRAF